MLIATTLLVLAFLIGAFPTGYLLAKRHKINIQERGSGNVGATNVARVVGKKAGIIVLTADLLKGIVAIFLCCWLWSIFGLELFSLNQAEQGAVFGFVAILGHCFSPFLKFKGGKGVATSLGVFLALSPGAAATAVVLFVILTLTTERVAIASMAGAIIVPVMLALGFPSERSSAVLIVGVLAAVLIVVRHSGNIKRLLAGEEPSYKTKPS